MQWTLTLAGEAIKQDLMRMVVSGNANTTGEFDGLERLVNTGYRDVRSARYCTAMDSTVVDWDDHIMTYTPNGTHALVDYLIDIVRRIRRRARQRGGIAVGDMILQMPSLHARLPARHVLLLVGLPDRRMSTGRTPNCGPSAIRSTAGPTATATSSSTASPCRSSPTTGTTWARLRRTSPATSMC